MGFQQNLLSLHISYKTKTTHDGGVKTMSISEREYNSGRWFSVETVREREREDGNKENEGLRTVNLSLGVI